MGNRVKLQAFRTVGRPVEVAIDPDATEGAVLGTNLTLSAAVTLPNGRTLPAGYLLQPSDLAQLGGATPTNIADWSQLTNIPHNVTEVAELAGFGMVVKQNDGNWVCPPKVVIVQQKADLPSPVAGVITLAADTAYWLLGAIDLTGSRLQCSTNNVISGQASGTTSLTSTGLVGALITGTSSLFISHLTMNLQGGTLFNLNDGAAGTLRMEGVTVVDSATLGTVANFGNVVLTECIFSNCANMTLDGTIASFVSETCLWDSRTGQTLITVPATATITRRFRFLYAAFTVLAGETGINLNVAATIPDEAYILDNVNFSGGGTYLAGVTFTSNKAAFFNNVGITNTSAIAQYYMTANATATVIGVIGTFVKAAGTTIPVSALQQKFNLATTNRAVYTGASGASFRVVAFASMQSGNNQNLRLRVAINGTTLVDSTARFVTSGSGAASNIGTQALVTLNPNDFVEIFVTNDTAANNITVTDLNVTVTRLN